MSSAGYGGTIPEYYDTCLGPAWFEAFGSDLAQRLPARLAGDVLEIAVWDNNTISRTVLVRPDGRISLPLLQDLTAAGLTPMQLREYLEKTLGRYISSPAVSVIVREVHSYQVSVVGQVKTPGRFQLTDHATVLDVLAMAGGLAGIVVAYWSLQLLIGAAPENLPRLADVTLDWRVAAFGFLATMVVGMLFGLAPSLSVSKPELNADLKDGGRTGTSRTGGRNLMVVSQVALALVLLIGAGLMLTSFARLRAVDPGFRTSELVTIELMVPLSPSRVLTVRSSSP